MTDEATANTLLSSESGRSEFGDAIILGIRCKDRETDMYIDWNQFVDTEPHAVEFRVGSGAVQTLDWNMSTDYEATFYPSFPETLIKSMFGQTEFVVRTTPYGDDPRTAVFAIAGIENAVVNVRQACGW